MRLSFFLILVTVSFISCSKSSLGILVNPHEELEAPASFQFSAVCEDCDQYKWTFEEGRTSKDSNANHTYYLSGNYEVSLKGLKGRKIKETIKNIYVTAPQKCLVRIETPYGEMIAELFEETPGHRENFVKLTEEGFYDDLLFHRVIDGFMIQGGDPQSRDAAPNAQLGVGGPGYQIDAEISERKAHTKGALAAARKGDQVNPQKKSSGSQFYIVQGRSVDERTLDQYQARLGIDYPADIREQYLANGGVPFLDQQYTVFGQVIEGLDVIDRIAEVQTGMADRPIENVTMKISLIK